MAHSSQTTFQGSPSFAESLMAGACHSESQQVILGGCRDARGPSCPQQQLGLEQQPGSRWAREGLPRLWPCPGRAGTRAAPLLRAAPSVLHPPGVGCRISALTAAASGAARVTSPHGSKSQRHGCHTAGETQLGSGPEVTSQPREPTAPARPCSHWLLLGQGASRHNSIPFFRFFFSFFLTTIALTLHFW